MHYTYMYVLYKNTTLYKISHFFFLPQQQYERSKPSPNPKAIHSKSTSNMVTHFPATIVIMNK